MNVTSGVNFKIGHVSISGKGKVSNEDVQIFLKEITVGTLQNVARGGVVVKAPRYKPAGRGFDSQWCHWNFSVT